MKKPALHWQIILAIAFALLFGWLLPEYVKYVSWMGTVFIRALKMIVIPLVLSSLISGVTNAGSGKSLGRLGIKTLIYYLSTSLLAICTGLILVNLIQPGKDMGGVLASLPEMPALEQKAFSDILIEIVPTNLFQAFSANEAMLS
ncbi:MAG: cation:dicarboxylase symporter family transporter, partial [Bacteroidales bacterium]|nr:cation:dicarboxylase symporter family transporter [Bacteroidales bacterium]